MLAKDSGISSVVGISMLVSVVAGKPLLTSALKPFVTKGDAGRTAAWERLSAEPGRFVRAERMFTAVWGLALVTECVVRNIFRGATGHIDTAGEQAALDGLEARFEASGYRMQGLLVELVASDAFRIVGIPE